MSNEKYHHADCFMKGITDDRQARSAEVVEIFFRIKLPRWSPWL